MDAGADEQQTTPFDSRTSSSSNHRLLFRRTASLSCTLLALSVLHLLCTILQTRRRQVESPESARQHSSFRPTIDMSGPSTGVPASPPDAASTSTAAPKKKWGLSGLSLSSLTSGSSSTDAKGKSSARTEGKSKELSSSVGRPAAGAATAHAPVLGAVEDAWPLYSYAITRDTLLRGMLTQ